MTAFRARWAAIGAAVAVSVGAGGLGVAHAVVDSGPRSVFVPINPCRVLDTRNYGGFNVGPRDTPIGPDESYAVRVAGGTNGECTEIPAEAIGVVMNVTMVDNSEYTYLTVYPSDEVRPNASNLNALAGRAEPTPNAVTVELSDTGTFSIYNLQGTANVIADVAGYYEDHNHDDRYPTDDELAGLTPTRAFVTINPDGSVRSGSDGITVVRNGTGDYTLTADLPDGLNLDDCAIVAVADQPSDVAPIPGLTVNLDRVDDVTVDVATTDVLGVATDSGLSVTIDCIATATV